MKKPCIFFKKIMERHKLLLLAEFLKFMKASQTGRRSKYPGRKLSKGTITQYKCVYQLLQQYEKKMNLRMEIVLLKKSSLSALKKEKKYWEHFLRSFLKFLYKNKKCFDNYVAS